MNQQMNGEHTLRNMWYNSAALEQVEFEISSNGYDWYEVDALIESLIGVYVDLRSFLTLAGEHLVNLEGQAALIHQDSYAWVQPDECRGVFRRAIYERHSATQLEYRLQNLNIPNVVFSTCDGGYDTDQVDALLDDVQDDLNQAIQFLAEVEARLDRLLYDTTWPQFASEQGPWANDAMENGSQDAWKRAGTHLSKQFAITLEKAIAIDSDILANQHKLVGCLLDLDSSLTAETMLLRYAYEVGAMNMLIGTDDIEQRKMRAKYLLTTRFIDYDAADELIEVLGKALQGLCPRR